MAPGREAELGRIVPKRTYCTAARGGELTSPSAQRMDRTSNPQWPTSGLFVYPREMQFTSVRTVVLAALAILAQGSAGTALAQTKAQSDRIEQLARYSLEAVSCDQFGFTGAPADVAYVMFEDPVLRGLDRDVAVTIWGRALKRAGKATKTEQDAAKTRIMADGDFKPLYGWMLEQAKRCQDVASDPVLGPIVGQPENYDPATAARIATDKRLERGGLASWQTVPTRARGDFLFAAGVCHLYVDPAKLEVLVRRYEAIGDLRATEYYKATLARGRAQLKIRPKKAQCDHVVERLDKALATRPASARPQKDPPPFAGSNERAGGAASE